jgi:hypothetical protein
MGIEIAFVVRVFEEMPWVPWVFAFLLLKRVWLLLLL